MKKILNILASASLITTSTTTVIACSGERKIEISSIGWEWNLGEFQLNEDEIINQEYIIKKIAEVNNISVENSDEIEKLASIYFNFSTITSSTSIIDEKDDKPLKYKAEISANIHSNVLVGKQTITFIAKPSDVKKSLDPISLVDKNVSGYWYQWRTQINNEQLSNNEIEENEYKTNNILEPSETLLKDLENSDYSIVNLAYLLSSSKTNYDTDLDLWLNEDNIEYLKTRNTSQGITDSKKYVAAFGGATGDRMLFTWEQKNEFKKSLKTILDDYRLDGIDLTMSGQTLYNLESQETISQAIREIMVERWLNGEDFYLSLSPKLQYLFLEDYERNAASYIPFIESLEGWYDEINVLITNIYTPKYKITSKETIEELGIRAGENIEPSLGAQSEGYFYSIIRSLIDSEWNKNSGYYSLVNKPVRIGLANEFGTISGWIDSISSNSTSEINIEKAFNQLTKDVDQNYLKNIIGINNFAVNIDQVIYDNEQKNFTYSYYFKELLENLIPKEEEESETDETQI